MSKLAYLPYKTPQPVVYVCGLGICVWFNSRTRADRRPIGRHIVRCLTTWHPIDHLSILRVREMKSSEFSNIGLHSYICALWYDLSRFSLSLCRCRVMIWSISLSLSIYIYIYMSSQPWHNNFSKSTPTNTAFVPPWRPCPLSDFWQKKKKSVESAFFYSALIKSSDIFSPHRVIPLF